MLLTFDLHLLRLHQAFKCMALLLYVMQELLAQNLGACASYALWFQSGIPDTMLYCMQECMRIC